MRNLLAFACFFALVTALPGCATILNDDTQPVSFSSDPQGAEVSVDGAVMGRTPCTLPIVRKGWDKEVDFTLDGHKPLHFTLKNNLNAAVAGNILIGGIIGGVVDGISGRGGSYQKSVQVVLAPLYSADESRVLPAGSKKEETAVATADSPSAEKSEPAQTAAAPAKQ